MGQGREIARTMREKRKKERTTYSVDTLLTMSLMSIAVGGRSSWGRGWSLPEPVQGASTKPNMKRRHTGPVQSSTSSLTSFAWPDATHRPLILIQNASLASIHSHICSPISNLLPQPPSSLQKSILKTQQPMTRRTFCARSGQMGTTRFRSIEVSSKRLWRRKWDIRSTPCRL